MDDVVDNDSVLEQQLQEEQEELILLSMLSPSPSAAATQKNQKNQKKKTHDLGSVKKALLTSSSVGSTVVMDMEDGATMLPVERMELERKQRIRNREERRLQLLKEEQEEQEEEGTAGTEEGQKKDNSGTKDKKGMGSSHTHSQREHRSGKSGGRQSGWQSGSGRRIGWHNSSRHSSGRSSRKGAVKKKKRPLSAQEIEDIRRSDIVRTRKETSALNRQEAALAAAAAAAVAAKRHKQLRRGKKPKKHSNQNNRIKKGNSAGAEASDSGKRSSGATNAMSSGVRLRWTNMKVNLKSSSSRPTERMETEMKLKQLRTERAQTEHLMSKSKLSMVDLL